MEFKEKNRTARELASPEFIEKDRSLLESIRPGHDLLSRCTIASRRETLDNEILYVLLDAFTPEEIINNRYGVKGQTSSPGKNPTSPEKPEPSKKKSRRKKSIQKSTGHDSKTKTSRKQS